MITEMNLGTLTSLWLRGEWRTSKSGCQTPTQPGKHTFPAETSADREPGRRSWCQTAWAAWPERPLGPDLLTETLRCRLLQSISTKTPKPASLFHIISLLCIISCNNVCTQSYPESPVSIYGNDEVDDINEKHESIDVAHGTVIWVDYVVKKLSYG